MRSLNGVSKLELLDEASLTSMQESCSSHISEARSLWNNFQQPGVFQSEFCERTADVVSDSHFKIAPLVISQYLCHEYINALKKHKFGLLRYNTSHLMMLLNGLDDVVYCDNLKSIILKKSKYTPFTKHQQRYHRTKVNIYHQTRKKYWQCWWNGGPCWIVIVSFLSRLYNLLLENIR